MAPENANIFFLDDNVDYLETMKDKLEEAGHSVPLVAHTLQEGKEAILKFEEHHINVAILDRRLNPRDEKNADGERIGEEIQRTHTEVILIGNSTSGIECARLNNYGKEFSNLIKMVTEA